MQTCLLLGDGGGRLDELAPALSCLGCACERAPRDVESFCAREAERGLALIGAAEGSLRALLLAERYPVEALVLVGCPLRPRGRSPLRRRAEHNLFCVVADLLVIQPLCDAQMLPRGADVLLRGVNSRRRKRLDLGRDFADMWINCKQPLIEAILDFLQPENDVKRLARPRETW